MRATLLPLTSLLVSCFIMMLGNGLINILLPVRMDMEAMPTQVIGIVLSLYYAGMLVGAIYARHLIQRAGHVRMFAGALALAAASILACSLFTDAWLWGAMRVVIGFCNACAFTAMESWLSGSATKDNRGKVLAFYQVIVLGALFSGQFLINLADPQETALFILGGMLLCVSIIPIVLSGNSGPRVEDVSSMSLLALLRLSPLGVVSCLISGVIYSAVFNMLPVFAKGYGVTGFDLSLYMGAAIMGAFLLQFPVGYLSDRFDRRSILLIALLISSVAGLSVNLVAGKGVFWATSLATAITSGIIACVYPLSISESFDKLRQSEMVAAMGCLVMTFSIGGMTGPLAASFIMKLFGNASLFWFLGAIQMLLGGFVIYQMFARSALPSEQQEQFVMQGAALASIADIDPRTEYQEPEQPLSSEAELATEIAHSDPAAAVNLARAAALSESEQGSDILGAVATVEGIDVLRLYRVMQEAVPEQILPITSALVTAKPEMAYKLVSQLALSMPDKVIDVAAEIGRTIPELRLEMARIAVETAPESAIEVADYYSQVLAEEHGSVRPADRDEDTSEQEAVDLVTQISELVPEQAIDVAATVVEAIPDTATSVATEFVTNLSESHQEETTTEAADSHADDGDEEPALEVLKQDVTDFYSRMFEVAPDQSLDIAEAVIEAYPESAYSVTTEYASNLLDSHNEESVEKKADTSDTSNTSEEADEELYQEVAEVVTRLSEAAPGHSLNIAGAVVEAIPDSASAVATEYASTLLESRSDESIEEMIDKVEGIDTPEDALDELNTEVKEFVVRLSQAAPGKSLDIAGAVVETIPECASDIIDEVSKGDESVEHELAVNLEDRPKRSRESV